MSLIKLENVTVAFQDTVILKDISLQITAGESFVIVGPSGQGKTTLMKVMCGLITPCNGKVFIEQKDLMTLGSKDHLKAIKKMGVLFQKNALFDSLTCYENIAFPLREIGDLAPEEIHKRSLDFLTAVGLLQAQNLFPDEISGGMQKRLGIARALALEPEILFYDDPTAGLDPITSRQIVELILRLRKKHSATLISVTNDMNRAYQLADRIGVVMDQELILTGTPEQTKNYVDPRVRQFVRGEASGPLTSLQ